MHNLYQVIAERYFAEYDVLYYKRILNTLEESDYSGVFNGFEELKEYYLQLEADLKAIQNQHPSVDIDTNKIQISQTDLDKIYSQYESVRNDTRNVYAEIAKAVDIVAQNHLVKYKEYIDYTLKQAADYIAKTNNVRDSKANIELRKCHNNLLSVSNFISVESRLASLEKSTKRLRPAYESPNHKSAIRKVIENKEHYSLSLIYFNKHIHDSFRLLFAKEYNVELIHDQVITLINTLSQSKISFLKAPDETKEPDDDLNKIITFLTTNIDFFTAPFRYKNYFQFWSLTNRRDMQKLSDALWKYMSSPDQLKAYKMALIGTFANDKNCLQHGDSKLMRWFLSHPCSAGLTNYLHELADDYYANAQNGNNHNIITQWHLDKIKCPIENLQTDPHNADRYLSRHNNI